MSQAPPAFSGVAPVQLEHKARMRILGAVMVGIFLAALDQTIVGTALPRIITDLRGNELYTWAITAYLLTSTISGPLWGKLSDLFGRRPIFLSGIAIFMFGSLLAGLSQEMWQLVVTRGVQGLGAGALFPIALAVIADLFAPSERGRYQGLFGAVFGVSTLIGPALGGIITDNFGWPWVFFLNLPIGAFVSTWSGATCPATIWAATSRASTIWARHSSRRRWYPSSWASPTSRRPTGPTRGWVASWPWAA